MVGPQKSHNKIKILLVEDDEDLRSILSLRLLTMGYVVLTAVDGAEGLEAARESHPDLIILDLNLPQLSGEVVCKSIREAADKKFSKTPIIMTTAKASDVDAVIGKVIGANSYIRKPYAAEDLLAEISKYTA